jgi:hypothetical protein
MEEIDDAEIPVFSRLPQEDADAVLAKEMAAMSVQEREQSLYDIHGVSDVIHEEPDFIRAKLEEMEMELSKLTRGKEAYMQADAQNKEYVICHKFRLQFLRAEMFNARLAAGRMVRFFEVKRKLFGPDKLTKEIKLRDLDEEDQKFLGRGIGQIVPQRDRAGRRIIIWMPTMIGGESDPNRGRGDEISRVRTIMPCARFSLIRFFIHPFHLLHTEKKMRTLYYLLMAANEDEETQKKGMVGIYVNIRKNRVENFEPNAMKIRTLLTRSLPFRWGAFHFCVNDTTSSAHVALGILMLFESRVRARSRKHEGELCQPMIVAAEHTSVATSPRPLLLTFYPTTVR